MELVWSDSPPSSQGYYWFRFKVKGKRRWEGPYIAWVEKNKVTGPYKGKLIFRFSVPHSGCGLVGESGLTSREQWVGPLVKPKE